MGLAVHRSFQLSCPGRSSQRRAGPRKSGPLLQLQWSHPLYRGTTVSVLNESSVLFGPWCLRLGSRSEEFETIRLQDACLQRTVSSLGAGRERGGIGLIVKGVYQLSAVVWPFAGLDGP